MALNKYCFINVISKQSSRAQSGNLVCDMICQRNMFSRQNNSRQSVTMFGIYSSFCHISANIFGLTGHLGSCLLLSNAAWWRCL